MTDEITLISFNGLQNDTCKQAQKYFSDNEIAQIVMQIGIINTWNRIAVSTHMRLEE